MDIKYHITKIIESGNCSDWSSFINQLKQKRCDRDLLLQVHKVALNNLPLKSSKEYKKILVGFAHLQSETSFENARRTFEDALELDPECAVISVFLAQFEHHQNDSKKASRILINAKTNGRTPKYLLKNAYQNLKENKSNLFDGIGDPWDDSWHDVTDTSTIIKHPANHTSAPYNMTTNSSERVYKSGNRVCVSASMLEHIRAKSPTSEVKDKLGLIESNNLESESSQDRNMFKLPPQRCVPKNNSEKTAEKIGPTLSPFLNVETTPLVKKKTISYSENTPTGFIFNLPSSSVKKKSNKPVFTHLKDKESETKENIHSDNPSSNSREYNEIDIRKSLFPFSEIIQPKLINDKTIFNPTLESERDKINEKYSCKKYLSILQENISNRNFTTPVKEIKAWSKNTPQSFAATRKPLTEIKRPSLPQKIPSSVQAPRRHLKNESSYLLQENKGLAHSMTPSGLTELIDSINFLRDDGPVVKNEQTIPNSKTKRYDNLKFVSDKGQCNVADVLLTQTSRNCSRGLFNDNFQICPKDSVASGLTFLDAEGMYSINKTVPCQQRKGKTVSTPFHDIKPLQTLKEMKKTTLDHTNSLETQNFHNAVSKIPFIEDEQSETQKTMSLAKENAYTDNTKEHKSFKKEDTFLELKPSFENELHVKHLETEQIKHQKQCLGRNPDTQQNNLHLSFQKDAMGEHLNHHDQIQPKPQPRLTKQHDQHLQTTGSKPRKTELEMKDPVECGIKLLNCDELSDSSQPQQQLQPLSSQSKQYLVQGKCYNRVKCIGKGGFGKVYEVVDSVGSHFALKRVKLTDEEDLIIEGHMNEINMLTKMRGIPRIIHLYDWERTDDYLNIVMEKGDKDLQHVLKTYTDKLPVSHIKDYWQQLLETVKVVHLVGIVHADLKPANFLFVGSKMKLIDFGISSSLQGNKTSITRNCTMGTVSYMSPEALMPDESHINGASRISRASDVWSLGCMLYFMAIKRTPYQHIRNNEMRRHAIQQGHPIDYNGIYDNDLLDCLQGCLKYNKRERYTIEQLLQHPFLTR